jgi:hypothetical protein
MLAHFYQRHPGRALGGALRVQTADLVRNASVVKGDFDGNSRYIPR